MEVVRAAVGDAGREAVLRGRRARREVRPEPRMPALGDGRADAGSRREAFAEVGAAVRRGAGDAQELRVEQGVLQEQSGHVAAGNGG